MLDLRAVSSGGGTTLTAIATILLGGDGQVVAGVPVVNTPGLAKLVGWGGMTTIADTIRELKLTSTDLPDQQNPEYHVLGTSSLLGYLHNWDQLSFVSGARNLSMRQNTVAANNMGYFMDYYPDPEIPGAMKPLHGDQIGGYITPRRSLLAQIFGSALTAISWGNQVVAPSVNLAAGYWAILGAKVSALTNYGLLRFVHADFGNYKPGFPVIDKTNTALANAVDIKDPFFAEDGYQFVALSRILKRPCIPVFRAGAAGSGLSMDMAAITADTPNIMLNLAKVA